MNRPCRGVCMHACVCLMPQSLRDIWTEESFGLATERASWFMPPRRKSHGRAVTALLIQQPLKPLKSQKHGYPAHCAWLLFSLSRFLWLFVFAAMLQADDEDEMMEMQMKSPFGSSFRTFNATDYKPIGKASCPHLTLFDLSL